MAATHLEKVDAVSCCPRQRGSTQLLSVDSSKACIADGTGSSQFLWSHIWKGIINTKKYIEVLEQHMLPVRQCLVQGRPVQQLISLNRKEWDIIPRLKRFKDVYRPLLTEGMLQNRKRHPVQTLEMCCCHQSQNELIFSLKY